MNRFPPVARATAALGTNRGSLVVALGVAGAAVAAEKATLADAAEHGNAALIRKLLDAGADVNAAQVDGMTALHWAVVSRRRGDGSAAGASGRRRQRRESLWRASAVPGLHERQRETSWRSCSTPAPTRTRRCAAAKRFS